MYYCSLILQDQTWPWTEELEVLSHLEAEDVAKFVPMLLSRTFIECYIAGTEISFSFIRSCLGVQMYIYILYFR